MGRHQLQKRVDYFLTQDMTFSQIFLSSKSFRPWLLLVTETRLQGFAISAPFNHDTRYLFHYLSSLPSQTYSKTLFVLITLEKSLCWRWQWHNHVYKLWIYQRFNTGNVPVKCEWFSFPYIFVRETEREIIIHETEVHQSLWGTNIFQQLHPYTSLAHITIF